MRKGTGPVSLAVLALLSAAIMSCPSQLRGASQIVVAIGDSQYTPQEVTILVGVSIFWRNNGSRPHTSTSDTGLWDSKTIQPSGGWLSPAFLTTGIFNYHSAAPSDQLLGKVIVLPADADTLVPETINGGLLSGFILSLLLAGVVTFWFNYPSPRARGRPRMS